MKSLILLAILAAFLLTAFVGSANDAGVRGDVATDAADSFTWTPQNFAGFYSLFFMNTPQLAAGMAYHSVTK